MKLCEKCRAQNADSRIFCVDCGATLGEKLSDAQEAVYQQHLSEDIERMYNRTDPLYVSLFDKITGILALLGCVASVALPFFKPYTMSEDHPYVWAFIFFAVAALDAWVPHLAWELEKLRMGIWVNGGDDLQPSNFYLIGRRVGNALAVALGALLLALPLLSA